MIDPVLLSALNNEQDRLTLLKLDYELERFLKDQTLESLEFPPMALHQRTLLVKVAEYFSLDVQLHDSVRPNGSIVKQVTLSKNETSEIPALRIGDLHVEEREPEQLFKIMKRGNGGKMKKTEQEKKRHKEDLSRKFQSQIDNNLSERQRLEEKEEAYQKVRKRIFSGTPSPQSSPPNSRGQSPRGSKHASRSSTRSPSPIHGPEEFSGDGRGPPIDQAANSMGQYHPAQFTQGNAPQMVQAGEGHVYPAPAGPFGSTWGDPAGHTQQSPFESQYNPGQRPLFSNGGFFDPLFPPSVSMPVQQQALYYPQKVPGPGLIAGGGVPISDTGGFYNPYIVYDVERRPPKSTELYDPNAPRTKKNQHPASPGSPNGRAGDIGQDRRKVKTKQPYFDYSGPSFRPQAQNMDLYSAAHILEVYDFPRDLKTYELDGLLSDLKEGATGDESGSSILKYVDSSRVLAVFKSAEAAKLALERISHPSYKIRNWNAQVWRKGGERATLAGVSGGIPRFHGVGDQRGGANDVDGQGRRVATPSEIWHAQG